MCAGLPADTSNLIWPSQASRSPTWPNPPKTTPNRWKITMASVRYTIAVDDNREMMLSRQSSDCVVSSDCHTFRFQAHQSVLAAIPYFAERMDPACFRRERNSIHFLLLMPMLNVHFDYDVCLFFDWLAFVPLPTDAVGLTMLMPLIYVGSTVVPVNLLQSFDSLLALLKIEPISREQVQAIAKSWRLWILLEFI